MILTIYKKITFYKRSYDFKYYNNSIYSMKKFNDRRKFIKTVAVAGIGVAISGSVKPFWRGDQSIKEFKVGIIGLDTEHSVKFTQILNDPNASTDVAGCRVIAAYPRGSNDIESSVNAIPGFIEEIKKLGVEIVDSIETLLQKVDVVLLETNDGRLHLEQALLVLKSGKPLFIDKPIAASLADAISIFKLAEHYNVPVFSSSSLRYMKNAQKIAGGKIGNVLGTDTYGPATIEKTHPDLFWYGVHGIEALFTVMGTGCKNVVRFYEQGWDMVVGTWEDNRIGTFRGLRTGATDFGGTVFADKGISAIGPYEGYRPLVVQIVEFFHTAKPPVSSKETLEIFAFMEAAQESREKGGVKVSLASVMKKANRKQNKYSKQLME